MLGAVSPQGALVLCHTAEGQTAVEWAHPSAHHHAATGVQDHVACAPEQDREPKTIHERGCRDQQLRLAKTTGDRSVKPSVVSVFPVVAVLSPVRFLAGASGRDLAVTSRHAFPPPRLSEDLSGVVLLI